MTFLNLNTFLAFSGSDWSVTCCVIPIIVLIIASIWELIRYSNKTDRKASKAREERIKAEVQAKREAQELADFRKNSNILLGSQEYKFVEQFAKKYGVGATSSDYSNLQMLLNNRGIEFSVDELKSLVISNAKGLQVENIKKRILEANPLNLKDFVRVFLNFSQPNDEEMLQGLADLLRERNLYKNNSLQGLKIIIKRIEKVIELENFEKRLSGEDKQVRLEDVDQLGGYEFEDFLKTLFSRMGFQVEQTRLSGDQGADLVVVKFGEKTVIQAKRFTGKVGNKAVQEIMAAISLYQAHKGMVVTNSYFTPAAVELAKANNIELVDRDGLEKLINKHW